MSTKKEQKKKQTDKFSLLAHRPRQLPQWWQLLQFIIEDNTQHAIQVTNDGLQEENKRWYTMMK
jgi:hypothetical protein